MVALFALLKFWFPAENNTQGLKQANTHPIKSSKFNNKQLKQQGEHSHGKSYRY